MTNLSVDVLILCGGRGVRMREKTQFQPKPLIPVAGTPTLERIINYYQGRISGSFILATGYLSSQIHAFATSKWPTLPIVFSDAGEGESMLGRIWRARTAMKSDHVIVAYGDTFMDIDVARLMEAHQKADCPMTLVLGKVQSPFGLVEDDNRGLVTRFDEKPILTYYVGTMVVRRSFLDSIPFDLTVMPDGRGLVTLIQQLVRDRKMGSYLHQGRHVTFNNQADLVLAEDELRETRLR